MSEEEQTEDEPSIEEILDSIRQIISEDDEDEEGLDNQEAEAEVAPEPEPENDPPPEVEEEPDLSEELDQSAIDDIDFDAPSPAPVEEEPTPEPEAEPEEDILELTDIVNTEDNQIEVDLQETEEEETSVVEVIEKVIPEPEPEPEIKEESEPVSIDNSDDALLTTAAEAAAVSAMTDLVRKTAVERNGVTLEDIVRTELKPLLRDWLDKHLPTVIERLVQEELERVSKRVLEE